MVALVSRSFTGSCENRMQQKSGVREEASWLVVNGSQGAGRLEVLHPEGGFICEPCLTVTRLNSSDKMNIIKDSKDKQNGKLQVLGTTEKLVIESIDTAPRKKICAKDTVDKYSNKISQTDTLISRDDGKENARKKEKVLENVFDIAVEFQSLSTDDINEKLPNINKDREDEESSDDLSEKEDEKEKAPIELMGEFLAALMDEDYKLASKLCQMILIYEPENPEAKQFLPLIEKKLQMEETEQNPGDENDDETDDDSSDESDDTTSDDSESEEDSEETSDDLSEQEGESGNSFGHNLLGW